MARPVLMPILAVAVTALGSGCGTVQNNIVLGPPPPDCAMVYGGVRTDMAMVCDYIAHPEHRDRYRGDMIAYTFLDVPLCVIADTLLLPLTVAHAVKERDQARVPPDAGSEKQIDVRDIRLQP
jgi:uncharacterized protein YceK